jgi:hypothetical protein
LRLLKVVVQPHFVLEGEDGELESELVADPVTVKPRDWPDYAHTTFVEAMEALERQYQSADGRSLEQSLEPAPLPPRESAVDTPGT